MESVLLILLCTKFAKHDFSELVLDFEIVNHVRRCNVFQRMSRPVSVFK